jgi:eukaryotic-like serine/threonine-protein kinase
VTSETADETLVDGERLIVDDGAPPPTIGRYVVLDRLGAGGMGIVYAAWDPGLDRRVAIKVLFASRHHEDELAEARALARFSHPDVVSIYDAGTIDGRVWIAMELLDGLTLDRWARAHGRSWQGILRVLVAAGRGLAAVHEAGLVHRDVKPSNVFVADDGRVLVMDFGLATADMTATTGCDGSPRVLGTLAYMAPEQYDGGIVDARADQFAFCVVAWELLHGEHPFGADPVSLALAIATRAEPRRSADARPVPAWLRDVLRRGLAPQPQDRHASMAALLAEIGRGRRRRRGRDLVFACGSALALVGALVGVRHASTARREAECRERGLDVDAVWPGARGAVRESVSDKLGSLGAERSERITAMFDEWSVDWKALHASVCEPAATTDELEHRDARLACFSRDLTELDALVDVLLDDEGGVDARWVEASRQLPKTGRCLENRLSSEDAAPPVDDQSDVEDVERMLVRARALRVTGDFSRSLELAERAHIEAQRVGWPPLSARAGLELARSLERTGDPRRAVDVAQAAYFDAARAGDDEIATTIAGLLAFLVGDRLARVREANAWIRHARSRLDRLDADGERQRPALWLDEALLAHADGDDARAKQLREAALAEYEVTYGVDDPMTAAVVSNLAVTYERLGELDRAAEANRRAAAIVRATYGPDHPELAVLTLNLGTILYRRGEIDEAEAKYREALPLLAEALGESHSAYLTCWSNLAAIAWRRNDLEGARTAFRKAAEIGERTVGENHPQYASILYNLGVVERSLGSDEDAERLFLRTLTIRDRLRAPDHRELVTVLVQLAYLHRRVGKAELAWAEAQRALAISTRTAFSGEYDGRVLTLVAVIEQDRELFHAAARHYARAIEVLANDDFMMLVPLVGAAEVALRLGDSDTALRTSDQIQPILERIPLADDLGARGWLACARARWIRGERARAKELLARAEAFAGGLDMADKPRLSDALAGARRTIR